MPRTKKPIKIRAPSKILWKLKFKETKKKKKGRKK